MDIVFIILATAPLVIDPSSINLAKLLLAQFVQRFVIPPNTFITPIYAILRAYPRTFVNSLDISDHDCPLITHPSKVLNTWNIDHSNAKSAPQIAILLQALKSSALL
ncbi:MAG: hypothetical protein WCJ39_07490 [bacterium]